MSIKRQPLNWNAATGWGTEKGSRAGARRAGAKRGLDMGMHTAHIGCVKLEFDPAKEAANLAKHGVDFSTVLRVFEDPNRMIIPNQTHSLDEPRFYAIGHDGRGILTVRFTIRGDALRVIGAGYWRKQKSVYENQKQKT